MWLFSTLLFLTGFILCLLLVLAIRPLARLVGFVDRPGGRKVHLKPTPYGGGIAIALGTALPPIIGIVLLGAFGILSPETRAPWLARLPDEIKELLTIHCGGILLRAGECLTLLGGALGLFLLGLIDDATRLGPKTKLIGQLLVATVVAALGIQASLFIPIAWIQFLLTVLYLTAICNSFNLLDNMDGLCATVALVAAGVLLLLAFWTQQLFLAFLLLPFLGAVAAFLFFNFPPASIFMGDAGSLFIGFFLSATTVVFTYSRGDEHPWTVILPLLIFAVPIYDTLSVILIRLRLKKSIMVGDTNHFSHRLVRLGMSRREVLTTVFLVALSLGLGGLLLYGVRLEFALIVLAQALLVLCLVAILERSAVRKIKESLKAASDKEASASLPPSGEEQT